MKTINNVIPSFLSAMPWKLLFVTRLQTFSTLEFSKQHGWNQFHKKKENWITYFRYSWAKLYIVLYDININLHGSLHTACNTVNHLGPVMIGFWRNPHWRWRWKLHQMISLNRVDCYFYFVDSIFYYINALVIPVQTYFKFMSCWLFAHLHQRFMDTKQSKWITQFFTWVY